MVISEENESFKNQPNLKCSMQREKLLNSSYKHSGHSFSSSGYSPPFGQVENVLRTTDLIENNDLNERIFETIKKENEILLGINQYNVENQQYYYDLENMTLQGEECFVPFDDKLDNFQPSPKDLKSNKKNKIVINSATITNKKTDETSASSWKELPSSILQNKKINPEYDLKIATRLYHKNEVNPKNPHFHTRNIPLKNSVNTKIETLNVINKEQKRDDVHFPHHSQNSFITKEHKTASFSDDCLDSNRTFPPHTNFSSDYLRVGCSADCLEKKIADIFRSPMGNELNSHISLRSTSEFDPHVCYMEPKYYSLSCQGIPCRMQRYGVPRTEPQRIPIHNPENNSYCTSTWDFYKDFSLFDLDEEIYCRRNPMKPHLFQNTTIYQNQPEFYNLNKPATEDELRQPFENDPNDFTLYQKGPNCCNCNKATIEKTKVINTNDDNLHQQSPTKKKKRFTCFKSGKVDRHERSTHLKPQPDPLNSEQCKSQNCPSNVTFIKNPHQETLNPNATAIQNILTDMHIGCNQKCPMMHPEKERQLLSIPAPKITKSVGCECCCKDSPPKYLENTADLQKNITIQIIPNYCQKNNTPVGTCPNVEQKIMYPQGVYCQEISCERKQSDFPTNIRCQNDTYFPYTSNKTKSASNKDERQYSKNTSSKWWGCNWSRKKPQTPSYHRNPSFIQTSDCCTRTCNDVNEDTKGDGQVVEISNRQRILPIKNNYTNRDGDLLKSLHRLNRGLLKDLFATPCASTSSTCPNSCLRKIRGAPFPLCADTEDHSYKATKPPTTNQCCQYEPDCYHSEKNRPAYSSQDILCECLKYMKRGILNDNYCEYLDEDCCCCQSFNTCCCCHKIPKCCEMKEVIQPKFEEKKSCCTRCRSVEAKQSLKHCGTVVSNHCFTKVETVCTNTEIRPKTPEVRKKNKCCKRRCCCCCSYAKNCCCCNNVRNCCCCCEREIAPCCRNIHSSSCKGEHFIYCCQCEPKTIFECKNVNLEEAKEPFLEKSKEKSKINNIKGILSQETEDQGTKVIKNGKLFTEPLNPLQETSTHVKYLPLKREVLFKSITLDLCDLGEKKISKFGLPSRNYPWMNNSFFIDMPVELKSFVEMGKFEHPLSEKICDPTPCLKPEVLHFSNPEDQEIKLLDNSNAHFLCNEQKNDETFLFAENTLVMDYSKKVEHMLKTEKILGQETNLKYHNLKLQTFSEDNQKLTNHEPVQKRMELSTKTKNLRKTTCKSISKTSQPILSKTFSNISKETSNISKTSTNMNYVHKPFTTKTGLMSFIPSFWDNYRSPSQVKKNKSKSVIPEKTTKTPKKLNRNELGNKVRLKNIVENSPLDGNNTVSMNIIKSSTESEQIEKKSKVNSKEGILNYRNVDTYGGNHNEVEEKRFTKVETNGNERIDLEKNATHELIKTKKCSEEKIDQNEEAAVKLLPKKNMQIPNKVMSECDLISLN